MKNEPQTTPDLPIGAEVYTSDPVKVGEVKEVRATSFKVEAEGEPGFWLPLDTIATTTLGNRVALSFAHDQIANYQSRQPLAA
jgi:hypothetical protein